MASHHLDKLNDSFQENNKHFDLIIVGNHGDATTALALDESPFADIIFNKFHGFNIKLNDNNPFGKAAQTIKELDLIVHVDHQPPKYHVWKPLNYLMNVERINVYLNVTEIPPNALNLKSLKSITISTQNSITIKKNAFYNLDNLDELNFQCGINKIETEAFALGKCSHNKLDIKFDNVNGNAFQQDSFKGLQKVVQVVFPNSLQYLPESSLKSLLDNRNKISAPIINCHDCRNYWLIKHERDGQIQGVNCNQNNSNLFDSKVKDVFNRICLNNKNITVFYCNRTYAISYSKYLIIILIMFNIIFLITFLNYFTK